MMPTFIKRTKWRTTQRVAYWSGRWGRSDRKREERNSLPVCAYGKSEVPS